MSTPLLYTYFRSGAAQRVRIGLALKGATYDSLPVHLLRNGGEHLLPSYRAINPQARVPALQLRDGIVLAQSTAILEYLEETIPEAHRWGRTWGRIGFHGGKIEVERARVRGVEGREVTIPSWETAAQED